MKGYITASGYRGYIPDSGYILFPTQAEYEEAYKEWLCEWQTSNQ